MKLSTLQGRDVSLAYSNAEEDPRRGCIGHLRGDFGNGYGFWSVWFPHQKDAYNTPSFQQDLRTTINALRENVLRSLSRCEKFCAKNLTQTFGESGYGLMVETDAYMYVFRLLPEPNCYQVYCYCYDKEVLLAYRAERDASA